MVNMVLKAIKKRRNIINFLAKPVNDELLNTVLEAGRWAPSWLNRQPWKFIVVSEKETKMKASSIVPTVFSSSLKDAPVFIGVCVNPELDPYHFIEDGSAATQNMSLAAHSLGLGTCWIGAFSLGDERDSAERKLKELLRIPKNWRLISLIPLGYPKFKGQKTRKELVDIVDLNFFIDRKKKLSAEEVVQKTPVKKILTPTSTPPV